MEDLDIGFAQNLEQNTKIQDQFVFIYYYENVENKELTIYSLKNDSEPIVKYSQPPFKGLDYAFVV